MIDVYSGNGKINWKKVRTAGHSCGICKATEGATHIDSQFATNMRGLKSAGMVRGAYHFYHVGTDPVAQADFFIQAMKGAGYDFKVDLPPCLDIEDRVGATKVGREALRKEVSTFLQAVEKVTGRLCILYLDYDFGQNILGEGYGGHPLWVASYTKTVHVPSGWKDWTFWQYDDKGTVPGISAPQSVDMNRYNGTEADLRVWATR